MATGVVGELQEMGTVEAGVADVDVDAGGDRFDAEFEGRERREIAGTLGGELIHRNPVRADIVAGRASDGGAGEPAGGFDVMAVAGVGGAVPELGEDEQVVLCAARGWRAGVRE